MIGTTGTKGEGGRNWLHLPCGLQKRGIYVEEQKEETYPNGSTKPYGLSIVTLGERRVEAALTGVVGKKVKKLKRDRQWGKGNESPYLQDKESEETKKKRRRRKRYVSTSFAP